MSLLLGAIVGLVLGLTGAGGSVFAVPMLMFGLGWTLPQAAPVALLAVCTAAAFGTIFAWDAAYVRYRAACLMSATGLVAAPLGLLAAERLPNAVLALLFCAVLIVIALRLILQARRHPEDAAVVRATVAGDFGDGRDGRVCQLDPRSGRIIWTRAAAMRISSIGVGTGFLSGLLGVGGGFLIVPALRAGSALSVHSAVATSLMTIALTSAGTVLLSLAFGKPFPRLIALPFMAGALAGMAAGRKLAPRVAGPALQKGFAVLMLIAAGLMALRVSA